MRTNIMRTIVAFLFVTASSALVILAQSGAAARIADQEKRIAQRPDDMNMRQILVRDLTNQLTDLPADQIREKRRQQILWIIEHHPEWSLLEDPVTQLLPRGRLADPEGRAKAESLWMNTTAKPFADTKAIAHYALFYFIIDRAKGFEILDTALRKQPDDQWLNRARGILEAATIVGVSGVVDNYFQFSTSGALRDSPQAAAAKKEIDESKNPPFLEGAGEFLSPPNRIANVVFTPDSLDSENDPAVMGERWIRRAIELAPPAQAESWKPALSAAVRYKANRSQDAKEKVKLLDEAMSLLPEQQKNNVRVDLMKAEFNAGDDAAAERDAKILIELKNNAFAHYQGETILGRLAMASGDRNAAKEHLMASIKMPPNFQTQPDMNLAQDLLDAGDRDAVVEYLEGLRKIWTFDNGRIDQMINRVKKNSPGLDLVQMQFRQPGQEIMGRPAPAFDAKDLDGKTWTKEQTKDKVVFLVFADGDALEKISLRRLSDDYSAKGAVLLKASASREDPLARKFEIESNPTLVVINARGSVFSVRAGTANETDWRNMMDNAFREPMFFGQPIAPVVLGPADGIAGSGKVTLTWEPSDNAESYIVEWDYRDEKGWIFDREGTVRVQPVKETSTMLDVTGFSRVRWRVVAVARFGQPSKPSSWREIDSGGVTKIYNRP